VENAPVVQMDHIVQKVILRVSVNHVQLVYMICFIIILIGTAAYKSVYVTSPTISNDNSASDWYTTCVPHTYASEVRQFLHLTSVVIVVVVVIVVIIITVIIVGCYFLFIYFFSHLQEY
jgi:hypothetical protein